MNKCMIALVGCAFLAGAAVAASVDGNNVAVVIQKDPKQSANGFQFLCIPVKGFDIAQSGEKKSISLADILPPSTYKLADGAETTKTKPYVIIVRSSAEGVAANAQYNSDGTDWVNNANDSDKNPTLYATDVLWLNTGDMATTPNAIFCGESNGDSGAVVSPTEDHKGNVVAEGNYRSASVKISELVSTPANGDWLYVTQHSTEENETSDYLYYTYDQRGWLKWGKKAVSGLGGTTVEVEDWVPVEDTDTIAAGEAFYFYRQSK